MERYKKLDINSTNCSIKAIIKRYKIGTLDDEFFDGFVFALYLEDIITERRYRILQHLQKRIEIENQNEDFLIKNNETYNEYYRTYKAKYVKTTKLPLFNTKNAEEMIKEELYSVSRAKKEKVKLSNSVVSGWYKTRNGYIPLFKKN